MRGPDPKKVRIERKLRGAQTDAESKIWFALRDRRLDGFKFVRQEAIGPFIADFVCRERKLIIEGDGGQHAEANETPSGMRVSRVKATASCASGITMC
jgi:very-short-patch-repair endonuclease